MSEIKNSPTPTYDPRIKPIQQDSRKYEQMGMSLPAYIVKTLQEHPEYAHTVRDVVQLTGGKYDTVKRILGRLAGTGKGSGPVQRVTHGLYRYDASKEDASLMALARSGNWSIENILLVVSLDRQSEGRSLTGCDLPDSDMPKSCQPTTRAGFPWILPSGQTVTWKVHANGTEMIWISAKGAPPLSADHTLTLLEQLRKEGLDPVRWECKSLELNIDSRCHRIDASYSVQLIEKVILKAYRHGYNTRLEIADRRTVSTREVMELFHAITRGFDSREISKQITTLDNRIQRVEKRTNLALNIAIKTRDATGIKKPTRKAETQTDTNLPQGCKRLSTVLKEREEGPEDLSDNKSPSSPQQSDSKYSGFCRASQIDTISDTIS
jgi:hypothetical protein